MPIPTNLFKREQQEVEENEKEKGGKGEAAAVTTMGAQPHVNLPELWQIVKSCKVPTAVSRYTLYVCIYVLYEIRAGIVSQIKFGKPGLTKKL